MPSVSNTPEKSTESMVDRNRNSSAQQDLVQLLSDRIQALAGAMRQPAIESKIVDYGCGPGIGSIETVHPALNAWRTNFEDVPVVVCHADQVGNDWNTLFGPHLCR